VKAPFLWGAEELQDARMVYSFTPEYNAATRLVFDSEPSGDGVRPRLFNAELLDDKLCLRAPQIWRRRGCRELHFLLRL